MRAASEARDTVLRVQTWGGRWGSALRSAVSRPFERACGVRVQHEQHVGLALAPSLLDALHTGRRPPVDVVWSNSVPALNAALAGHCVPLDRARMPVLDALRGRARPDGAPARSVVHPYVVYYVLGYHQEAFPGGEPRSWHILLDERHRGRIALYPHGNGLHALAQTLEGGHVEDIPADMEACWSFLRRLRPQVAELEYSIGMEERLRARHLDLCFRALPNVLAFQSDLPVGWCVPAEGTADTTDALWIPRGIPDTVRDVAMRYIAFALRPDVQRDWCRQLGVMPVHPAAGVPEMLQRPDLPAHADDFHGILHIPESVKAAQQPEWEKRFAEIFG
ncbi:extracellular solute-binding protein [Streptomyces tubbatahanensis]|uniref:Extracellular solute-binding protein n=1 Tax=Streptomyces tubbatahanensis TaxID=2923272 RepID=A0ABY3Y2A6_9ACTN|nr:extracellular solute-binding protein [Streptomyces tubbatahanensis]UNT00653.1 extracellular solute-binding protein [Streptomyces tubbatahanensis]